MESIGIMAHRLKPVDVRYNTIPTDAGDPQKFTYWFYCGGFQVTVESLDTAAELVKVASELLQTMIQNGDGKLGDQHV